MRPYELPESFNSVNIVATSDSLPTGDFPADWRNEWPQRQRRQDAPPGEGLDGRQGVSRWDAGPADQPIGGAEGNIYEGPVVVGLGQQQRSWQDARTPPPSPPSPSLLAVDWIEPPLRELFIPAPPPPPSFPPPPPPLPLPESLPPPTYPPPSEPPPPSFIPPSIDEAASMQRAAEWAARVTPRPAAAAWQHWQGEEVQLGTVEAAHPFGRSERGPQSADTWSTEGHGAMRYDGRPHEGEATGLALKRQDEPTRGRFYGGPLPRPRIEQRTAAEQEHERPTNEVRI
jgi:hypothetical protein